jgi:hypothetical protein
VRSSEEESRMLEDLVSQHRDEILGDWFETIVAGYPPETAKFLREKKDPFGNPVGTALRDELGALLDAALGTVDERCEAALDRVIRVRAVQDFAPSAAVAFLLELKVLLRRRLAGEGLAPGPELEDLDRRVDRLVLAAFDVYNSCREQMHEIRVSSIRKLSLDRIEQLNEWRAGRDAESASDAENSQDEGRRREWVP